jgi:thiol-disulfide isomerase/thioredoxin
VVERLLAVFALLAVASVFAVWWQRREGRVTPVIDPPGAVSSQRLGAQRGFRATFVQFSTSTCAKCPSTAILLSRVAASERGVRHVEIDAESRLDLVREFDVLRTPTTLVLNHEGVVVARISGAPSEAHAREALEAAPPPSTDYSI